MARQSPAYDYPEPFPAVLITIHGRVWPGVLRRRSWSDEHHAWRWSVEICVDDRAVITSVAADQIEPRPQPRRQRILRPREPSDGGGLP